MEGTKGSVEWRQGRPEACAVSFQPPLAFPLRPDGMRREGFRSCSPHPTVLLCPSPSSEMDSRAVRLRGRQERLRVQSPMEGCPSLSCQGGGEGRLAAGGGERGRERSQPFELPQSHPLWPQETAPQMSLPGAREGGWGGFSIPAIFTPVVRPK